MRYRHRIASFLQAPMGVVAVAAITSGTLRAQTISGRVTDGSGAAVPHVRIVAFPVSDSSESATRVVISDAQGTFRFRVPFPQLYVVRIRRVGYRPEPDMRVDAVTNPSTHLDVTMTAIAITLKPVEIDASPGDARCLPYNDPAQSPRVKEWLDHALDAIRVRRIVQRDFRYRIQVRRSTSRATETMAFMHDPDRRAHGWMEDDPGNLAAVARALVRNGVDMLPTEVSIITPIFRGEYCFTNALAPDDGGGWTVHFRSRATQSDGLATSGTITFAEEGLLIARVEIEFSVGRTVHARAYLEFARLSLDGETYPILAGRGFIRAAAKQSETARVDERLEYADFRRVRESSPPSRPRLRPGS